VVFTVSTPDFPNEKPMYLSIHKGKYACSVSAFIVLGVLKKKHLKNQKKITINQKHNNLL